MDVINVTEFAGRAGVTPRTVQRWIREGRISARKFGRQYRISADELLKVLPAETERTDR